MEVDQSLQEQLKSQRLRALSAQWYDLYMTKIALEANGRTEQARDTQIKMSETETSYDAVNALPLLPVNELK